MNEIFVAEKKNRSDSDNGVYVAFVQEAVENYDVFKNFKRHPDYQMVLEHVGQADGMKYLNIIKNQSPEFLDVIDKFKNNDLIGNPVTCSYPETGQISPTTLRYIKVASDLKKYFGLNIGERIAEVGVGYGGQLLINDQIFSVNECHLFDLPPVLDLVSKYLESFILNCSYKVITINQCSGNFPYDLVISNYAFSELPSHLQRTYIKKVMSRSSKGYLTMNTGLEGHATELNHLKLDELRTLLPPFEVIAENPITSPNNYIIIWGHNSDA